MDRPADRRHGDGARPRPREVGTGTLSRAGAPVPTLAISPGDLVRAADALERWIGRRWPGAALHREWPLAHRLPSGTVVAGNADLVLEVAEGLVLVDHKLLLGPPETLAEGAAGFAPQLAAYATALAAATGRPVLARFVHLPLHGVVLRFDDGAVAPTP